jgi:hypothetical protein
MVYSDLDNTTPTTVTLKAGIDLIKGMFQQFFSVNSSGVALGSVQNKIWATGSGSDTEASFRALTTSDLPTDLTDGGDSTLHYHASDRDRANHTGTQSADTITDGSTNKAYTATEQTKLSLIKPLADVDTDLKLASYISGVTILNQNIHPAVATTAGSLSDGTLALMPIYLSATNSITGIVLCKSTTASYTGDNENSVSLYTESGGTLTRVALGTGLEAALESAPDLVQVAFSTPYAATAGIYWVGILPNWSSVSNTPALRSFNGQIFGANNISFCRIKTGTTAAPASQALSGTTITALNVPWVGIY